MNTLRGYQKQAKRLISTPSYVHLAVAAAVLGLSTIIWSLTIARFQQGNADQLADGFLFEHATTFMQAQFPAAHTQLLKWPLFWLLGILHSAPAAYAVATTALCLVTVGTFAYLLYRIVRRPTVLAVLYLGLACVLTLVPAQVLGNVSSPLSMAMVTGRNIEYLLYLVVLVLLLPSGRQYNWKSWGVAALLFGLLLASDQLFLICGLGGAAILLLYAYSGQRRSPLVSGWLWLAVAGLGWGVSRVLLWFLGHGTGIIGTSTGFSGHATSLASVHAATAYGLKGLALNFGISLSAGPLAVLPAALNALLVGVAIYAGYRVWRGGESWSAPPDRATMLSLLLGMSTLAAFVVYAVTNHAAMADARYLSIALFAGFVVLATYSRQLRVRPMMAYAISSLLAVGIVLGLVAVVRHTSQTIDGNPIWARNQRIAQVLAAHPGQILVGDFWRVLPIKEDSKQAAQAVLPLTGCVQPRQALSSKAWQHDLYNHRFVYLLPLQSPAGMPFGRCSLQTILFIYGQPTAVVRVAGAQQHPSESLLFYNDGASRRHGIDTRPPTPVFGVPTDGTAKPTGSTMVPLADPS